MSRSTTNRIVALLAVAALVSIGTGPVEAAQRKPNIIVVMTDDQTSEQMRFLPLTRSLIGARGVTFDNSFVSYPLCCPSRASLLSGQYMHNHGVRSNRSGAQGGYNAFDHANALPVWLQDAGYVTAHIGKYLNGYGSPDPTVRPPGWTEWYGGIDPGFYRTYDYRMNRNGVITQYGDAPADYQTDVLARDAVSFINRRSASPKPYFLNVAPLAPHEELKPDGTAGRVPIQPAPRHAGSYRELPLPKRANYDEVDVSDKPSDVRSRPRITPEVESTILAEYRNQAAALKSVDQMVQRIVDAVEASGELDDTIIVFTSDNGYFHGEHRIPQGKLRVYDESIRVPLLVRGPLFTPGVHASDLVVNIDLATTFVAVAGANPGRVMDGRSLLDRDPDRAVLFETDFVTPEYTAVRTKDWKWVEYGDGQRELYDMRADPWELQSRHQGPSLAPRRQQLATLLALLRSCSGESCRLT